MLHRPMRPVVMVLAIVSITSHARATDIQVPGQFATIQAAIDAAAAGDRVLVGPGLYVERLVIDSKAISIIATGGPSMTTIDGDHGGPVVTFMDSDGGHLRGFEIRRGTGSIFYNILMGGGVLLLQSSPRITNNEIRECTAVEGAGIACLGRSNPTIRSNTIEANEATRGAGILSHEGSLPLIIDNDIRGNTATDGAAIHVRTPSRATVSGNRITANAPVLGVVVAEPDTQVDLLDNEFRDNTGIALSGHRAEWLYMSGNRFLDDQSSGLFLRSCDGIAFIENFFDAQRILMNSCDDVRFERNIMHDGRIEILQSDFTTVSNSVFVDTVPATAESIVIDSSTAVLEQCTVVHFGSRGFSFSGNSVVNVVNTIAWGAVPQFTLQGNNDLTVRGCIVAGGWPGENNRNIDPLIVDGKAAYHLRPDSPCVDTGLADVGAYDHDIDGDSRIIGSAVDVGADEFRPDLAARYGNVAGTGERVLTVNGMAGDHRRVVRVDSGDPFSLELQPSTSGPAPAAYAIYAWLDESDGTTIRMQPKGLGWMAFPTPLQRGAGLQPVVIWNTLGYNHRLGAPTLPSDPAPSTLIAVAGGIGRPVKFTVQGFLQDAGSTADVPVSVTNAVVIDAR